MLQRQFPLPTYKCSAHVSVDSILVGIEPYIVALTRGIECSKLLEWEREEIAQRVRVKLSGALPGKKIDNLRAYLKTTVHNEFISFLRQRKIVFPMVTNEDGEPYQGRVLISPSQGMGDPQVEYEQAMMLLERLEEVVDAILELPPVQKVAMVCSLRDRIDDPTLLTETFKRRGIDITAIQWPCDRAAKQRLQASCRPARLAMARLMNIDLTPYKQSYMPNAHPLIVQMNQDMSMARVTATNVYA